MTAAAVDLASQRCALVEANRLRAEHLIAVAEGTLDPFDVIDAAGEPAGISLRRIELEQLFLAVEKLTPREWRAIRSRLLATLAAEPGRRDLTIGWVIDPRAGGRRYYALRDATNARNEPPWEGFPWCGPSI